MLFCFLLQRFLKRAQIKSPFTNEHDLPNALNQVHRPGKVYRAPKPQSGIRRIDRKRRENSLRMMNFRMEEKKILDRILGKGEYDPRIRPAGIYNKTGKT